MGHSTGFSSDDLLPRLITRERNVGQGCSAGKGWQNCSSNARALNKSFRQHKVKKVKEEILLRQNISAVSVAYKTNKYVHGTPLILCGRRASPSQDQAQQRRSNAVVEPWRNEPSSQARQVVILFFL